MFVGLLFGVVDLFADQTNILLAGIALDVLFGLLASNVPLARRAVNVLQLLILLLSEAEYLMVEHGPFVAGCVAVVGFGAKEAGIGPAAGAEHDIVLAGPFKDVFAGGRGTVDKATPVLQQVLILEIAEKGLELDGGEQDQYV